MFIELVLTGLINFTLLLRYLADERLDFLAFQAKAAHILRPYMLLIAHMITNNLIDYCMTAPFDDMI